MARKTTKNEHRRLNMQIAELSVRKQPIELSAIKYLHAIDQSQRIEQLQ